MVIWSGDTWLTEELWLLLHMHCSGFLWSYIIVNSIHWVSFKEIISYKSCMYTEIVTH